MKLQSNSLLENLTKKEINILTAEVKETIVKGFSQEKKRTFTAAEFWDIQRRKKNILVKRFIF